MPHHRGPSPQDILLGGDVVPSMGPSWWRPSLARLWRDPRSRPVVTAWLVGCAFVLATGLIWEWAGWSGIEVAIAGVHVDLTIYPSLVLTFAIALWIGPVWACVPAYITTAVLAKWSGMALAPALVFALASPVEVLAFWGVMVILGAAPALGSRRSYLKLSFAGLVSVVASSLAVLLWNAEHQLSILQGQRFWRGWVIGGWLQVVVLLPPLLRFGTERVRRWIDRRLIDPPVSTPSMQGSLAFVAAMFVMIGGLLLGGVFLLADADPIQDIDAKQVIREIGLYVAIGLTTMVAMLVVFTIALSRLGVRARLLAFLDPLTGAYNRHAFASLYGREAERARRLGMGLSVLWLDVDRFKDLNDRRGHLFGDAVLAGLSQRIRSTVRPTDLVFRWGGEEFVVLLPHSGFDEAVRAAQRLVDRIADEPFEVKADSERVTISVGVATVPVPSHDPAPLLEYADGLCYEAKRSGRNRVASGRVNYDAAGALA